MHSLIIGMTESGKSTFAKLAAKKLVSQGYNVAILDPIYDPDWSCTFRCDDPDTLGEYLRSQRNVFCFVDESGSVFSDGNDTSHSWLATRSRHYGHSMFFIAQRAIQIPKTMRDQCSRLFLFTSSRSDGIIHAEEWNKEILRECNKLQKLDFYAVDRFSYCDKMRIKNFSQVVKVVEAKKIGESDLTSEKLGRHSKRLPPGLNGSKREAENTPEAKEET